MTTPTLAQIAKSGQATPGTPEWKRKAILATNTAGVIAAPAAIGAAWRSARKKEGGMPRDIANQAERKLRMSGVKARMDPSTGPRAGARRLKAAGQLKSASKWLGGRGGRAARAAAVGTGAFGVGLQVTQSAGDALAAHENMGKKPRARAAAAIAGKREVNKGAKQAVAGTLKRLKPNTTQQKVIGMAGAGGLGYAAGKQRQKAKQNQYGTYYGGY